MQQATLNHRPINFKKERNFSQKLNATFEFLSQNFKPIGKNVLLISGPFALLTGIFYGIYQTYTFGAAISAGEGTIPEPVDNLAMLGVSSLGMLFFSLIALTLVVAIVMRHIRQYIKEGHTNIPTGELWNSIGRDFFRVLGTSLSLIFATVISIGLLMVPVFTLGIANPGPLFIGFLMLVLFAFFLIVTPALMLLYPIRSIEGVGIFKAFGRMFKLISGKWLSTAGLVFVSSIIVSVASAIFAIPMYIMLFMQMLHITEGEITAAPATGGLYSILFSLASGISMLGSFALYSLLFIAVTFQYFNLVERREASGLLERLESFGEPQTDPYDEDEHY